MWTWFAVRQSIALQAFGQAAEKYRSPRQYDDLAKRALIESKRCPWRSGIRPHFMHASDFDGGDALGKTIYSAEALTHTSTKQANAKTPRKFDLRHRMCANQIPSHSAYRPRVQLVHAGMIGKVRGPFMAGGQPSCQETSATPRQRSCTRSMFSLGYMARLAPERPYPNWNVPSLKLRVGKALRDGTTGRFSEATFWTWFQIASSSLHTTNFEARGAAHCSRSLGPDARTVALRVPWKPTYTNRRTLVLTWYERRGVCLPCHVTNWGVPGRL